MTDDTTITDSERDLLRFPAHPDILRFGTPVRSNNPERTYKGQAVILSVDPGRREARVAYARDIFPPEWGSLDDIALDLTDATGRAHLAWWLHGHNCAPDTYSWTELNVPTLATIDPNDPRILPDGSRLVDALDLSLVGRHLLAGGGK